MNFGTIEESELDQVEALEPKGWTGMRERFSQYVSSDFCDPVKVFVEDRIIGVGASIRFKQTAWLAHIVVHEDYRNRGIGLQIVNKLMSNLQVFGIKSVSLLSTPMGESVYKKANFKAVGEYIFFRRKEPWALTKRISPNVVPYQNQFYDEIMELDKLISGEERESMLKSYLKNGLLYLQGTRITGFYLPDLVEGNIYALNPEAGLEFMKIKYAKDDKAALPTSNLTAINFLKQNGFAETGLVEKRMVWGPGFDWMPICIYGRLGGNLG